MSKIGTARDKGLKLATGLVAGAVATWAMKKVTSMLESSQKTGSKVEEAFAEKKPAEEVIVDKVSKTFGKRLSRKQRKRATKGVKWGLGVGNGVAIAMARRRLGAGDSLLRGALFGIATFVIVDEILKPAIGVHEGPGALPWQAHARQFAGHATYGLVNAGVRKAAGRVLPN